MADVSLDRSKKLSSLYDAQNLEYIRVALHKTALNLAYQNQALLATHYHDLAAEFEAAKEHAS